MATLVTNTPAKHGPTGITPEGWAEGAKELHESLLAVGLVDPGDTGQLDFDSVTSLPTSGVVGSRIYQLEDGVSLPLFLKIGYAVAQSTSSNNRGWHGFDVSFGYATDGNANLIGGSDPWSLGVSQSTYANADDARARGGLISKFSISTGFVGVSWKQRYFNPSNSGPSNNIADAPAMMNFFLCRDVDDSGQPLATGASLIATNGGVAYNNFGGAIRSRHLSKDCEQTESRRIACALGADTVNSVDGKVPAFNIYTMNPKPRRLSQIVAINRAPSSMDQTSFAPVGTQERNYLVDPNIWPGDLSGGSNTVACIGMLWEE